MRRHPAAPAVLAVLCIVAGGCGEPPPEPWCDAGLEEEGVEVVQSSGPGRWEREGLVPRLAEQWRAAGLREGEELALPVSIAASPDGWIAVPDFLLGQVMVVDPTGSWQGSWTRSGEGPGEVLRPVAAAWNGAGRLAVFDVDGPKVVFVEDGEVAGEELPVDPSLVGPIRAAGELGWAGLRPDGGVLLIPAPTSVEGEGTAYPRGSLVLLELEPGAAPDTLARDTVPTLEPTSTAPVPGWPRLMAAVGAGGRLAVGGEAAHYRIDIYDPDGRHVRRVCRTSEPPPLRPDEIGGDEPGRNFLSDRIRTAPRPEDPAPFGRFFLGAGGRLWVQRERPNPVGQAERFYGRPGASFDVFETNGEYLGEVQAPLRARLQAAAGDTVWAFEFGDLDEAWLVAYRLDLERE